MDPGNLSRVEDFLPGAPGLIRYLRLGGKPENARQGRSKRTGKNW
jgi:hypothetical protein